MVCILRDVTVLFQTKGDMSIIKKNLSRGQCNLPINLYYEMETFFFFFCDLMPPLCNTIK